MSDLDIALPTQSDIDRDRHRELKTSATKAELIMSSDCGFPTSADVGSVIFESGIVKNAGLAVGIASPSVSVQKLFPLPVSTSGFVADI